MFEPVDIAAGVGRQVFESFGVARARFPSGNGFVDRLDGFVLGQVEGEHIDPFAAAQIADTQPDFVQRVELVEIGDRHFVGRGDLDRAAHGDGVEPAAAARPPGGGAEFAGPFAEPVAEFALEFGRQRPFADARAVGLHHADDLADARRPDSQAGANAAWRWIGAGDEWIRAKVHVEQNALRAFGQHVLAGVERRVGHRRTIGAQLRKHVGDIEHRIGQFVDRRQLLVVDMLEEGLVVLGHFLQPLEQALLVAQLAKANALPHELVAIGRADAAAGRADFSRSAQFLLRAVEEAVIRHDQVRVDADAQPRADILDAGRFQLLDFVGQHDGIDDHAIADQATNAGVKDAGGNQMGDVFFIVDDDGMAGVVAALIAADQTGLGADQVHDLPFAFVAPLAPYNAK
ncbi:MAG: hypothetical protein BWZ10_01998 [candidate division BRC1 bacterium ADurb.BinA364]|nr:MAG: hypothetical protein BWZ10_01998 [candidate division BRC1 bacterium ADurb.BinA364]